MKAFGVILTLLLLVEAVGQQKPKTTRVDKVDSLLETRLSGPRLEVAPAVSSLFEEIEKGIRSGSITELSERLGAQVFVNIPGGENGYFSSNQTVSVLQNYFAHRKPLSFSFTRLNANVANPYATGRLSYMYKGSKEAAQIYVSLSPHGSRWVIGQFNIY